MHPTQREVDAAGTAAFIEEGGLAVDVLVPEHHQARHIPGTRNACVHEVTFLEQVAALGADPQQPILLCGAGPESLDSRVAAEKLHRAGYGHVLVFPGGLEEWLAEGRPLEGDAPDGAESGQREPVFGKETYALVPEQSLLRWTGRNANGAHTGVLRATSGMLSGDPDNLSGSFTLDMASIRNEDLAGDELQPVLEAHLRSDDFFFVSRFPEARFEIASMTPMPGASATEPNYRVDGVLHLRGASRELSFPAHLRNAEEGLALMAHFDLDRTGWGVIYGSARFFRHLGYHVVHDDISVDLRMVLA